MEPEPRCPRCGGTGQVRPAAGAWHAPCPHCRPCPACGGGGWAVPPGRAAAWCVRCGGDGRVAITGLRNCVISAGREEGDGDE
jgi:DnaJ-class molecular chaperone